MYYLSEKTQNLLSGEEGKIEESEAIQIEIEKLKARKDEIIQHGDPANNQSKQMKVA